MHQMRIDPELAGSFGSVSLDDFVDIQTYIKLEKSSMLLMTAIDNRILMHKLVKVRFFHREFGMSAG